MSDNVVVFTRVLYGRGGVPLEQREYRLNDGSPVGCIKELRDWIQKKAPAVQYIGLVDVNGDYLIEVSTGSLIMYSCSGTF